MVRRDGKGWRDCDGNLTARDGAMVTQRRWTTRNHASAMAGDGDVDVDTAGRDHDARDDVMVTRRRLTTRNHASAMAMSMLTRPAMGAIKANAALNYKN